MGLHKWRMHTSVHLSSPYQPSQQPPGGCWQPQGPPASCPLIRAHQTRDIPSCHPIRSSPHRDRPNHQHQAAADSNLGTRQGSTVDCKRPQRTACQCKQTDRQAPATCTHSYTIRHATEQPCGSQHRRESESSDNPAAPLRERGPSPAPQIGSQAGCKAEDGASVGSEMARPSAAACEPKQLMRTCMQEHAGPAVEQPGVEWPDDDEFDADLPWDIPLPGAHLQSANRTSTSAPPTGALRPDTVRKIQQPSLQQGADITRESLGSDERDLKAPAAPQAAALRPASARTDADSSGLARPCGPSSSCSIMETPRVAQPTGYGPRSPEGPDDDL